MNYTKESTALLIEKFKAGVPVSSLCEEFGLPKASIIAKLSSLGIYKRKEYTTKRGEIPVKKEEYVERISKLLKVNIDLLTSLEKVNKSVLKLIEDALTR